jgi:hypothetical protein
MILIALALQAAPAPDPCHVDFAASMALGVQAFDQNMEGGWRELARRPGCEERAAELIAAYREAIQRRMSLLYWHEGQLRAGLGQNEAAIRLMDLSRKPDDDSWNFYVDATIAFLRGDRPALTAERDRLAALPAPADFREQTLPSGYRVRWPMNLDVVDGLVRCFGQSYRDAYGARCRAPPATP